MYRIVAFPELKARYGLRWSRVHLYRLIKSGKFPAPVRISAARVGWLESEVERWLADCAAARHGPDAAA